MRGSGRTTRQLRECIYQMKLGFSTIFVCASELERKYAMRLCCEKLGLEVQGVLGIARLPRTLHKTPLIHFTTLDTNVERLRPYRAAVDFDHHAVERLFQLPCHKINRWNELERLQERYRHAS